MKTIIRTGVFETNSSSTHTLVIMSVEEFKKWRSGKFRYLEYGKDKGLHSEDEYAQKQLEEYQTNPEVSWAKWVKNDYDEVTLETIKEYYFGENSDASYEFPTYDEFCDDEYLEVDTTTYTTKGGEEIVIVAKYGYNG